ncbi:MAG: alpha/beta hydrolase-fold protein [Bacteroidota bacterium]
MKKLIFCFTVFFVFNFTADARQIISENQQTVKQQLHSKFLKETQHFKIFLPESFHEASDAHRYPVILLLEDKFFHLTTGIVQHLSLVNRMPESIVVSLENGPVVPKLYTNGSDFWPEDWKQLPFGKSPEKFVAFVEKELFPYLENNYRANDYRIVIGFSGTSIFALHALAKAPHLFDAHVAIAAGDILGMGYQEGKSLIDEFEQNLSSTNRFKNILYVTSADGDVETAPMIGRNLKELDTRLDQYNGDTFRYISKVYHNENHYDVALPALGEAFNLIFPKSKWSADYRELSAEDGNALANIDAYYQQLSKDYGVTFLPMAERWNSVNSLRWVGLNLLQRNRIAEAIKVLDRRVQYRPRSVNAHADLSKAYEQYGQVNKAIEIQEKAVQLATKQELEPVGRFIEKLSELYAKAGIQKPAISVDDDQNGKLSKYQLTKIFENYNQIRAKVFSDNSTVADVDSLFAFYTDSFTYNHPDYGGIYSRGLLYNNTVKFLKAGRYKSSPSRNILNMIVGLNAIIIEEQYAGSSEKTVTLYKFAGDKINYIEEYW